MRTDGGANVRTEQDAVARREVHSLPGSGTQSPPARRGTQRWRLPGADPPRPFWPLPRDFLSTNLSASIDDLTLTVSRTISAPPEEVFEAWLDPEILTRFMTPGEDVTVPSATVDPVEGGAFEIIMKVGDKKIPHSGAYETIDRHRRLVFTWESDHSIDGSTVTVDFAPAGEGTEVTLTQVSFFSKDSRDGHEEGWTGILTTLGRTLETAGKA